MSAAPIIVAIDGPSGVGKSTVGSSVARQLNLPFLETGAMYRAVGWSILDGGVDPRDRAEVEHRAATLDLCLRESEDGRVEVMLDGQPLGASIRDPGVSEATSIVSAYAGVRKRLIELQREFAERRGAVVEGRDIGSRVFPGTPHKFFLDAPLEVRVERRRRQLEEDGRAALTSSQIEAEVVRRDERDSSRPESPLVHDSSYVLLDSSSSSAEEMAAEIVRRVTAAGKAEA